MGINVVTKTMKTPFAKLLLAAAVLVSIWKPAAAQSITATVHGVVTDSSGSRVAGATVTALNDATGERHTVESNATGDFIFTALPVGDYRIEAKATGFK